MPRPGTTITRSETRPARGARTATGPRFIAGVTGTADTDAAGARKPVHSLAEYAARFGSRTAHIAAGGNGQYMYDEAEFHFKEGGSELFVSVQTAGGVDAAARAANLATALARYTKDLGPGQVSSPGVTEAPSQLNLANHARDANRIGVLDAPDTANVATLTAAATIAGITQDSERRAAIFAPWVIVPGVTPGTTRTIPPSTIVAGLMAYNDGRGVSPNQPSAGVLGESSEASGVTQSFIDADRSTLSLNSVNLLRSMYDGVRVYGYRTLADPTADPQWINLASARLFMAIEAELDAVAERFVFRQIDGGGLTITEFGGALTGVLLPYWQRGSLYGATPGEAFRVDVGPNVNTDATVANRELRANVALKTSEFAEEVIIELVKTRITEAL